MYGTGKVQYLDFATGLERSKWYFEASPQEFYRKEMSFLLSTTITIIDDLLLFVITIYLLLFVITYYSLQ